MAGVRNVKLVELIAVEDVIGMGVEDDPVRNRLSLWTKGGSRVAQVDYYKDPDFRNIFIGEGNE